MALAIDGNKNARTRAGRVFRFWLILTGTSEVNRLPLFGHPVRFINGLLPPFLPPFPSPNTTPVIQNEHQAQLVRQSRPHYFRSRTWRSCLGSGRLARRCSFERKYDGVTLIPQDMKL